MSSSSVALAAPLWIGTSKPASLWLRAIAAATTRRVEGLAPVPDLSSRYAATSSGEAGSEHFPEAPGPRDEVVPLAGVAGSPPSSFLMLPASSQALATPPLQLLPINLTAAQRR